MTSVKQPIAKKKLKIKNYHRRLFAGLCANKFENLDEKDNFL